MELQAWQNEMTQLIMVLVVLLVIVWLLKDKIRTIIINPNEMRVELETTDDASSFGTRLVGLETQIEENHADLEKQIHSIQKEIGETKGPPPNVEPEENTENIQPNNESD